MSVPRFLALVALLLAGGGPRAHAQAPPSPAPPTPVLKWGVSAGPVRSFVYPQNLSTQGRYDLVRAEGQWGYELGAHAARALGPKTALDVGVRLLAASTFYDLRTIVPTSFKVTHTWLAARRNYRLYTGLSQVLAVRGNKAWRVFGGLVAGVETQQLRYESTGVSFYDGPPAQTLAVAFDYQEPPARAWGVGAEAGAGLRLYGGVDLNLRYNYNFTRTAPIAYTSSLVYTGPPGSPQESTGVIQGRPVFASAELVIWFN